MTTHSVQTWVPEVLRGLSDADAQLFRSWGAGTDRSVPRLRVEERFALYAHTQPNAIGVDDLGTGASVTYGELDTVAERVAHELCRRGVRPGDRVGVFARRGVTMVASILGVLRAGAVWVPQDARIAPPSALRRVAEDSGLRVVLTVSDLADRVRTAVPADTDVVDADRLPLEAPAAADCPSTAGVPLAGTLDPEAPAAVIYTSGTTGVPNGVVVTHANLRNVLWAAPSDLGIGPGVRVTQLLNVAFDMAVWEVLGTLTQGGTLVIRGTDIPSAAATAHVVIATPSVLATIDPAGCPDVRRVAVAGERCPAELADRWAEQGVDFRNACGPTEVSIVNTMATVLPGAEAPLIGRPLPRSTVYLLDDDLKPVPIGAVGEMWVGGDAVTVGYLHRPELTAERYRPDPFWEHMGLATTRAGLPRMFRTRDLARWTPAGELEIHGRTDDQVKVRGFRVELDAVAAALESVDGVIQAVAWKQDDRRLAAAVHSDDVSHELLREAAAARLPYYAVPAQIVDVASVPLTPRGKVDRAALAALASRAEEVR